ncbi:MAG: hypothetical protein ACREP9_07550 [Candidatus Dormibacteraceae bacterium]
MLDATYVGVTGYTSLAQARHVHEATRHLLGPRILMDGYLVWSEDVNKRWKGKGSDPANFASRFLTPDEGERVFQAPSHGSLRLIHFRTRVHTRLDEQLQDCIDRFGYGVDGFQINWILQPQPQELAEFRRNQDRHRHQTGLSNITMVLQLHPNVLARATTTGDLVRYVAKYVEQDAITHVLYDPSGGQGIGFQPDQAIGVISRLKQEFPKLHYAAAGGLSPENVHDKVAPLWIFDPSISIDIEGQVREPNTDALDLRRSIAYVSAALDLGHQLDPEKKEGTHATR